MAVSVDGALGGVVVSPMGAVVGAAVADGGGGAVCSTAGSPGRLPRRLLSSGGTVEFGGVVAIACCSETC